MSTRKIAVPSDDGVTIAGHFGRSACFLVFEVEESGIRGKEVRTNTHEHGDCSTSGGERQHGHGHGHADIVALLDGCTTVLCRGMGWRAAEALQSAGIEPLMTDTALAAEEAVAEYLQGTLPVGTGSYCRCHG